ncbi:MAG: alkaline phosphatase family protein, partial [Proteobacteria bacterium]|nr:alkaline phosphatase family protein [Pseudomonadota bacterium]
CPNLGRIAAGATTVRSELPELSPVNWTSFFTGEGPEVHGVYGFTAIDPVTYTLSLASSESVRCPTIFDRLGEAGLVSKVVNLPNTYPAKPLRGMMISGFVAERLDRAVYPPFLGAALSDYLLEADTTRGAADPAYLLSGLRRTLASRGRALNLLWPDLEWDLFTFVLTETDRLFHFFHPAVSDPAHPLHADMLALLREWDGLIGEILARYDALAHPKRLLVLADHGFTDLKTEVDLNAFLRKRGNLHLDGLSTDEWDATHIAPRTTAFALDPGRIHLHTRDIFPRATLSRPEAGPLLPGLMDALTSLTWRGERVMKRVLLAEELYGPNRAPGAPDLVCEPNPGFDLKAKFNREEVFGLFGRFGTHTPDGAIFSDSEGARPERLRDVGRIIMEHFQVN